LFKDVSDFEGNESPDAVFIGTPPAFRGTLISGRNVEIAVLKRFPSSALFVEKPVSSAYPSFVQPLIPYFHETGTFVAVGYMLRYLKGSGFLIVVNVSGSKTEGYYYGEGDSCCLYECVVSICICFSG
jgi:predicted dehydrogenase